METTLGFEPTYPHSGDLKHAFVRLDMEKPLNIEGYDVMLQAGTTGEWIQQKSKLMI